MKQPHEDVRGVQRDSDLLRIDEESVPHRDALIAMARHLQSATLVGNPAPLVADMYQRITHPQIGDLVVETAALYRWRKPDDRLKSLGYLLEHRTEWCHTDAEWAAAVAEGPWDEEDNRPTDHAWYVQYAPNPEAVCRWVNCSFLVLPITIDSFDEPMGTRDATGVTVTRGDLLGALGRSGFSLGGAA